MSVKPEQDARSPGTRVTEAHEPHVGGHWTLNQGHLIVISPTPGIFYLLILIIGYEN